MKVNEEFIKNSEQMYRPRIEKNDYNLAGVAAQHTLAGEKAGVISKAFISTLGTSKLDERFSFIANQMLKIFNIENNEKNNTIILLKKNNIAEVYTNYPFGCKAVLKEKKEPGTFIFQGDIIDIEQVFFRDDFFQLPIEDGDKLIWIFEKNWRYGLYFDLTGELKKDDIFFELAYCYKELEYAELYKKVKNEKNIDLAISNGWFPFSNLIFDGSYSNIVDYHAEEDEEKKKKLMNNLLDKFTEKRLLNMNERWEKNLFFKSKIQQLNSGIMCFNQENFIACIHTLYPYIESIIKDLVKNQSPDTNINSNFKAVEHLREFSKTKFKSPNSLLFSELFMEYLKNNVYKKFNSENLNNGRHCTLHGEAEVINLNKERALQLILILDQLYFLTI